MMRAPAAPTAPAWLTVAIPKMIEPSTTKMSASGGTSASVTLIQKSTSKRPSWRTGGAMLGRTIATIRMKRT